MQTQHPTAGPAIWLAAANGLWLAGGALAYFTSVSLTIVTAVAAATATMGILQARAVLESAERQWADRALSYAVGTWAVMAMLVAIPYVVTEEGLSLWSSYGFAGISALVASAGMLAWNVAAVQAMGQRVDREALRRHASFHALAIIAAVYFLWSGDGGTVMLSLRGDEIEAVDLQAVPALAAMPGIVWGLVFLRARRS